MSRLIFSGIKGWNTGDHLTLAAERMGLSLSELDAKVSANAEAYDAKIRQNEADQKTPGHWGVPLMVFEGEPFFGQDRIDVLIWRMKQAGLQARSETR